MFVFVEMDSRRVDFFKFLSVGYGSMVLFGSLLKKYFCFILDLLSEYLYVSKSFR